MLTVSDSTTNLKSKQRIESWFDSLFVFQIRCTFLSESETHKRCVGRTLRSLL